MKNYTKHWKNYMTNSKEQMIKFKGEICDNAITYLRLNSGYRWTDVLDYICEYWDLDKDFDGIIDKCCKVNGYESFEQVYNKSLNETKYKLEGLNTKDKFSTLLGKMLVTMFEESLKKQL